MTAHREVYEVVFIGGGPAGTGALVAAARRGLLDRLLAGGVAVMDRGPRLGRGALGDYGIASSTLSPVFLECLDGVKGGNPLSPVAGSEPARALAARGATTAPLPLVGDYLEAIGRSLGDMLGQSPASRLMADTEARSIQRRDDGLLEITARSRGPDGRATEVTVRARSVVLAAGGRQDLGVALGAEIAPGLSVGGGRAAKVLLSDRLLRSAGLAAARLRLAGRRSPRVVIVGGSHSAFSVACQLLYRMPEVPMDDGAMTIVHRRPIRPYYASPGEAERDGYTGFGRDDVCPMTGRVHRLGGLRGEEAALYRGMVGLGSGPRETRARLARLGEDLDGAAAARLLDEAALIVPAYGYRPALLPLRDAGGRPLGLRAHGGGPLVDARCRVIADDGQPLPGIFAVGIGSGFRPVGEPSFQGQVTGVWLYQHPVGDILLDELLRRARSAPGARRVTVDCPGLAPKLRWMRESGIQAPEGGPDAGGVHAWICRRTGARSYLYSEITGYFMTLAARLAAIDPDGGWAARGERAARWIVEVAQDPSGAILCRKPSSAGEGVTPAFSFEERRVWLFDCAVVGQGLLATFQSGGDPRWLAAAARVAGFVSAALEPMEAAGAAAFDLAAGRPVPPEDRWSRHFGPFELKCSIFLDTFDRITGRPTHARLVDRLVARAIGDQLASGRFATDRQGACTHLHPHFYAVEGLLYLASRGRVDLLERAEAALDWAFRACLRPDALLQQWSARPASVIGGVRGDALAQALRAHALARSLRAPARRPPWERHLPALGRRLAAHDTPDGGTRYGMDEEGTREHANAWCHFFTIEAELARLALERGEGPGDEGLRIT